jgi:putative ATP-binding cassette transporter
LDELLFLPQRPYLPPGTLRELLTGAGRESVMPDEEVLTLLHDRGLGPVLQRAGGLDAERDWLSELSLEEQQLLALTRLSLASPCFAFLDRPGSVVGSHKLGQALKQLSANSISYVMLGRATDANGVFDAVLDIQDDGRWEWKPASH